MTFFQMAMPTQEELDRQLDDFVDKIVDNKDQLPRGELDDAFWKVRQTIERLFSYSISS